MEEIKFGQKYQDMAIDVLKVKLEGTRRDLFGLRLNAATKPVKDQSQYKKLRRQIARLMTAIRAKEVKSVVKK
jgi:ribosomal protein L29